MQEILSNAELPRLEVVAEMAVTDSDNVRKEVTYYDLPDGKCMGFVVAYREEEGVTERYPEMDEVRILDNNPLGGK